MYDDGSVISLFLVSFLLYFFSLFPCIRLLVTVDHGFADFLHVISTPSILSQFHTRQCPCTKNVRQLSPLCSSRGGSQGNFFGGCRKSWIHGNWIVSLVCNSGWCCLWCSNIGIQLVRCQWGDFGKSPLLLSWKTKYIVGSHRLTINLLLFHHVARFHLSCLLRSCLHPGRWSHCQLLQGRGQRYAGIAK